MTTTATAAGRLVGITDIARTFEVPVAGVRVLARLPDFPRPAGEICDELVWRREDIARWQRRNPVADSVHETGPAGAGG
jgi:hypothetical protein